MERCSDWEIATVGWHLGNLYFADDASTEVAGHGETGSADVN